MTKERDPLTQTQILAAASEVLKRFGFSEVSRLLDGVGTAHRLFEDSYSIVAVAIFLDWNELLKSWMDVQSAVVEEMTESIPKDAPKSWDGYLVLLTPGILPPSEEHHLAQIRYNTGRVRKLIATGDMLIDTADVETAILPLLPLSDEIKEATVDGALARLPDLLAGPQLPSALIRAVVDAFTSQEPLLETIHKQRGES